jgi:hypothetical protein
VHWHSLPVRDLAWSADGEHFFSCGGEAVLVKWNAGRLVREELAPRLGGPIDRVVVTERHVAIALRDLNVKTFNHQLFVESHMAPYVDLSGVGASGFQWHAPTGSFAYVKSNGRAVNFYDAKAKKDVLTLEIDRTNEVLGGREAECGLLEPQRDVKFKVSADGLWLVSALNADVLVRRSR